MRCQLRGRVLQRCQRTIARALAPAALFALGGCVPELGVFDGRLFGAAVQVDDPQFGKSRSPKVFVTIEVDEHGAPWPADVGRLVKEAYFQDTPPFTFKVSYACGALDAEGRGTYTDPRSIWFNVFVGYYEIDVSKARWGRPFGYRLEGGQAKVELGDVMRIGKADWNYFSNHVYGVPLDEVKKYDELSPAQGAHLGRVPVGRRWWDLVEISGVEVVSAYTADAHGDGLVTSDPISTPLWRDAFGGPNPRPELSTNFSPTRMHGKLYMSYREGIDPLTDERVYRTVMFGGSANDSSPRAAENQRFLEVQLEAVRSVMTEQYPDLGFR